MTVTKSEVLTLRKSSLSFGYLFITRTRSHLFTPSTRRQSLQRESHTSRLDNDRKRYFSSVFRQKGESFCLSYFFWIRVLDDNPGISIRFPMDSAPQ